MATTVIFDSLSALTPVTFAYNQTSPIKQGIKGQILELDNGLSFYQNELTKDLKDAKISNNTFLGLTPSKNLSEVFIETNKELKFGEFVVAFYLAPINLSEETLKIFNNKIYVGGVGEKALLTLVPVHQDWQEIRIDQNNFLVASLEPPFEIEVTNKELPSEEIYRKYFKILYVDNHISIQIQTKHGYRYLSYGEDRQIKGNGLFFKESEINSVTFIPNFVTATNFSLGYIPFSSEVGYHNSFKQTDATTVDLQRKNTAETHYLISCSTESIISTPEANINLAQLKTNFNPIGTFKPAARVSL